MRLPFLGLILALAAAMPAEASIYTFTTLSVPGAVPSYYGTQGLGINSAGQVVGTYTGSTNLQGFVFDQANAVYTIFNDPASTTGTVAQAINNSGQIVGYIPFTSAGRIFLRDPTTGTFTNLPAQANQLYPTATGIDDAGQIVGYFTDGNNVSPTVVSFVRNPATGAYAILQDPNSGNQSTPNFTVANGIDSAGQVVGYYADNNSTYQGFLFDPSTGTYTTISYPTAIDTMVQGINNSGQVVGYYDDDQGTEGFVLDLTTGAYTALTVPGALATFAQGIDDSGQIVGYFRDGFNVPTAFLATPSGSVPVPEPASLALLSISIFGLGVARHRRTRTS